MRFPLGVSPSFPRIPRWQVPTRRRHLDCEVVPVFQVRSASGKQNSGSLAFQEPQTLRDAAIVHEASPSTADDFREVNDAAAASLESRRSPCVLEPVRQIHDLSAQLVTLTLEQNAPMRFILLLVADTCRVGNKCKVITLAHSWPSNLSGTQRSLRLLTKSQVPRTVLKHVSLKN